jgi:hypothetical protein
MCCVSVLFSFALEFNSMFLRCKNKTCKDCFYWKREHTLYPIDLNMHGRKWDMFQSLVSATVFDILE